jgi:prepilin-type processing-associated H-X9-DG protein
MNVQQQRSQARDRRGITHVEVLAMVGVLAVFAVLLPSAILASRETSRAKQCQDRLRQIGKAFGAHHDTHGTLPPCRTKTPVDFGWCVNLLPYLGEERLHQRFRFDRHFHAPENQEVVKTPLAIFQCPATPTQDRIMPIALGSTDYGTQGIAGDYFVNHILNPMYQVNGDRGHPVLLQEEFQPLSAVTDGLSTTTIVMEQAGRPDHFVGRDKQANNSGLAAAPGWWGTWASYQTFQLQSYATDHISRGWDCSVNCNNSQGMYSFHQGGANVLFCDGHVRFLSDSIPGELVFALASRNSQEIVGTEQWTVDPAKAGESE